MSLFGTKRTYQDAYYFVRFRGEADISGDAGATLNKDGRFAEGNFLPPLALLGSFTRPKRT